MSRAPAPRFELRPSWPLAGSIAGAHGAAAACAALVAPGAPGGLLAAALVALGMVSAWRKALLRGPKSVRAVEISPNGLVLESADGNRTAAAAAERRYVSRRLVAVPLRAPARGTLLVTAGMLEPAAFRRLRLWALWGRLAPVAGPQLAD